MPPDNTVIRLEQLEGRPGEHIVGEVERWRALTWPTSFTLDSLDRPESQWICSGEILSQTADLKEVEIRWTEASDSEMLGFLATDSFSAMTIYLNLKVRHTRPRPTSTTPAFPALIDPIGFPETIPDRVFVSTVGKKDFLNEAAEFHKEWKIPVTRVGSFQEILEGVAKMGSAATLRIVSHAFDIPVENRLAGLLELPMFRGAQFPSLDTVEEPAAWPEDPPPKLPPEQLLNALAKSEVALVETLLGYLLHADMQVGGAGGGGLLADFAVGLVRQHIGPAPLAPFAQHGLDVSGRPIGAVRELVGRAVELAALEKADQAGSGIKDMHDAVNFILDARHHGSLRTRVIDETGRSIDEVRKLEEAIGTRVVVGAGELVDKFTVSPEKLTRDNAAVTESLANAVRGLRPHGRQPVQSLIDASRRVFRTPGRIDVRGCEIVGEKHGKPLLAAIRQIFDPAEATEISGATMFAAYPRINVRMATDAELDALKQDGAPEISEEFDWWAFMSGAIRNIGGIDKWNSLPFPPRGIDILDMGVPVPILDRRSPPPQGDGRAVMFALGMSMTQEGLTREACRRLLTSMWVHKDGSRPKKVLIDHILDRWAAGHPPRTAVLKDELHLDAFSPHRIYFQGDGRFVIEGIDVLLPVGRGISRQEINIRF